MTAPGAHPHSPQQWLKSLCTALQLGPPTKDDLNALLNLLPLFTRFEVRPEEVVAFYEEDKDWHLCAVKAATRLSPLLRYNVVPHLMIYALVNHKHGIFMATNYFTEHELDVFATSAGWGRY